jgi:hypothetical protein
MIPNEFGYRLLLTMLLISKRTTAKPIEISLWNS